MFRKNKARGFTVLEFLFAASLLAVLTAAGLFAVRHLSQSGVVRETASAVDHAAYSILETVSLEMKNSGGYGAGSGTFYFVDGGTKTGADGKCDPATAKTGGTDCITFESVSYDGKTAIRKSFFVDGGILKLRNSNSSRNQSLTPDSGNAEVEDFQISFLISGSNVFTHNISGADAVEAVRIALTFKYRSGKPGAADKTKTYSVTVNPRNI